MYIVTVSSYIILKYHFNQMFKLFKHDVVLFYFVKMPLSSDNCNDIRHIEFSYHKYNRCIND